MGGGDSASGPFGSLWESLMEAGNATPQSSRNSDVGQRAVGKGLEARDVFDLLDKQRHSLSKSLFGSSMPPVPKHSPVSIFGAMQRLHHVKYAEALRAGLASNDSSAAGDVSEKAENVALFREYLPFATEAYCTVAPTEVEGCPIVHIQMESSPLGAPSFYIARNDDTKRFIVAVRGTQTVEDALTDLAADTTEFCGGIAHKGIADAAVALMAVVKTVLPDEMKKHHGFSVAITGHSLGGGVTALLTKLMLDDGSFGDDIVAVAIAPPPVFAPIEGIDDVWASSLSCFVNADDIVPRMSMLSLRNFVVETLFVDQTSGLADLEKASVAELDFPLPNEDNPVAGTSMDSPQPKEENEDTAPWKRPSNAYPRLYIPAPHGVNWLVPQNANSVAMPKDGSSATGESGDMSSTMLTLPPASFPMMYLTASCVDNHMVLSYKSSLEALSQ